jgi:hypothetical protein
MSDEKSLQWCRPVCIEQLQGQAGLCFFFRMACYQGLEPDIDSYNAPSALESTRPFLTEDCSVRMGGRVLSPQVCLGERVHFFPK